MEVSGVVFRQIPSLSGAATDTRASSTRSFSSVGVRFSGKLPSVGFPLRKLSGVGLSHGFADKGHLQHYFDPTTRCGLKEEKVKEKKIRKRAKLIKGLTKDLVRFSSMGFGLDPEAGLVGEVQSQTISEAAGILLKQLEQLKAEEKELKKKRKEEKAKEKSMKMKTMMDDSESSSSSSESSDSECDQGIDMNCQRSQCEPIMQPTATEFLPPVPQQAAIAILPVQANPEGTLVKKDILEGFCNGATIGCECSAINKHTLVEATVSNEKRIEVCMGGKCKRSGGAALLEEFQRVMSVEGSVFACKCMGKCRNGPNVRVVNQTDGLDDSLRNPVNPLYIGVALQDVGTIVSGLFGEEYTENLGLSLS